MIGKGVLSRAKGPFRTLYLLSEVQMVPRRSDCRGQHRTWLVPEDGQSRGYSAQTTFASSLRASQTPTATTPRVAISHAPHQA